MPSPGSPSQRRSISQSTNRSRQQSAGSGIISSYPSHEDILAIFRNLERGDFDAFFAHVSPDVDWTLMGTHPCAERYSGLADLQGGSLARIRKIMRYPGLRLLVRNVIGGGEQAWATVELVARAQCLSGLRFENTYAWCVRFDEASQQIAQAREYSDSWLVKQAIEENEGGQPQSHRAPVPQVD